MNFKWISFFLIATERVMYTNNSLPVAYSYVCLSVCARVCTRVHACVRACVCVCVRACMHACLCVYVCVCVHAWYKLEHAVIIY